MINELIIPGRIKKLAISTVAFLFFQSVAIGQIHLSIDQFHSCDNNTLNIPLNVTDFNNISAFTIYLQIDTLVTNYLSLENVHPGLGGAAVVGNYNIHLPQPSIVIVWSRLSPVSIGSGKLFDLVLNYKSGVTDISFSQNCEIVLSDLNVAEDVNYLNGLVGSLIVRHPQDLYVAEGETALFSVNPSDGSSYQWQKNSGAGWIDLSNTAPYSGTDTHEILISNVPESFDSHLFRCIVTNTDCQITSDSAALMVSPLQTSEKVFHSHDLNVYPVPSSEKLFYQVSSNLNNVELRLVNLLGKLVYQELKDELVTGQIEMIPTSNLLPGLYFFQIIHEKAVLNTRKILVH